jgi:hypothetical protein
VRTGDRRGLGRHPRRQARNGAQRRVRASQLRGRAERSQRARPPREATAVGLACVRRCVSAESAGPVAHGLGLSCVGPPRWDPRSRSDPLDSSGGPATGKQVLSPMQGKCSAECPQQGPSTGHIARLRAQMAHRPVLVPLPAVTPPACTYPSWARHELRRRAQRGDHRRGHVARRDGPTFPPRRGSREPAGWATGGGAVVTSVLPDPPVATCGPREHRHVL